ncbi:MAG: cyclic nucleotide-binding domain-containing protein [Actinomycetota bacterium]|nr:cyclic nucleotide-binding domain-containing protein [Actinomycetota bacterium]
MRIESSVTSLSWIPTEAISGMTKVPFATGMAHWDEVPPDQLDDLEVLRKEDRFRFANNLRAWVEIDDAPETWQGRTLSRGTGRITASGFSGAGLIGSTTLKLGKKAMTFAAVPLETQQQIEKGDGFVRFTQTAGGRTGVPAPRPVPHPPFFQFHAPIAWTTLQLTIYADGRSEFELKGASPFPRHWVYDHAGTLVSKSGLIDYKDWAKHAFGARTPWGDEDSPAVVAQVETALEHELSFMIMRKDRKPRYKKIKKGKTLTEQGEFGDELFLLLDGVLSVEVDGQPVAEVGPGAILGELAILGGGRRTSTLRAVTNSRVAVAAGDEVDRSLLEELAKQHRRESE